MARILVTGGTGNVGMHLVDLLHARNADFIVMVRNPEKEEALRKRGIDTVHGSFDDNDAMQASMQGIGKLFLLTPPSPKTVEWQTAAIEAAMNAEVEHIVKLSIVGVDRDVDIGLVKWHRQVERTLRSCGLEYTMLNPHSFMQNWLLSAPAVRKGQLFGTTGEARIPFVDARDVAEAAFEVLKDDGHEDKSYTITGPVAVSMPEVAHALSEATGHPVEFVNVPHEAGRQAMLDNGLPEWLADDLTAFNRLWEGGTDALPMPDFKELTGNPGRAVQNFANDYAEAFR